MSVTTPLDVPTIKFILLAQFWQDTWCVAQLIYLGDQSPYLCLYALEVFPRGCFLHCTDVCDWDRGMGEKLIFA